MGGHHYGAHAIRSERVDRDRQRERRIDAAGKSQQDARETVLRHVVADTERERAIHLRLGLQPRRDLAIDRRAIHDLHERERLFERRKLVRDLAVRIHDEGCAVEHELVLPADQVHVDEREPVLGYALAHHVIADILLVYVVRRRVGDEQDARAGISRSARRMSVPGVGANIDAHARTVARFGRAPHVLADVHAELHAVHCEDARRARRLEITLLVENGVVGEIMLVVDADHFAVAYHRSGVVALAMRYPRVADDERDAAHALGEIGDRVLAFLHEIFAQEQVFGRITADRELRRDHHVRAAGARASRKIHDARNVAREIADRHVHLRNRNFHKANISSACTSPSLLMIPSYPLHDGLSRHLA